MLSWTYTTIDIRPKAPRHLSALDQVLEYLSISKCIHRAPEALVSIRHQLLTLDQPTEWLNHKLLAILNVVENLSSKNKIAAVYPDFRFLARTYSPNGTLRIEFSKMEADRRMDGNETSDLAALFKPSDHIRQRCIGQSVAIVREKDFLVLDKMPDRNEAFANIAPSSGIHERYSPIHREIANDLNLLAKIRNDAVAIGRLSIVQEKLLDNIGLISEAKDEIAMAVLTVILHDVPQDWLMPNRGHRFRNALRIFADACA